MDNISEARLALVHPKLAAAIRTMAEILALDSPPIIFRVTQGLRTWDEQSALFARGRTHPGPRVTNAPPGHTWHQFGLAVDLVPLEAVGGLPDWNAQHPVWQRLIRLGQSLGLTSGSEWRSFPDFPHFQLTGNFPPSPDDEVRQIFLQAGTQGVWLNSGLEGENA